MPKNKRCRPSAATPGRRTETGTCDRASTSTHEFTTWGRDRQPGMIEKLLSPGAENALPLRHLVKLTGLPARQVRQMIQAERLRGVPILADNLNGYFLPENPGDIEDFVRSMYHRAYEITRAANAVRRGGVH